MLSIHHSNEQLIQRYALRTSGILAKIRTGTFGKQGGIYIEATDAATKIGFIGAVKILRGLSLGESQQKFWSSVPEEPFYSHPHRTHNETENFKGLFSLEILFFVIGLRFDNALFFSSEKYLPAIAV